MQGATATPRVKGAQIGQFVGHIVRVVGKVLTNNGSVAMIETDPGQQVTVRVKPDTQFVSAFVEVIGRVGDDRSVQLQAYTNFGDGFDMETYNTMVDLTHEHKDLF